MGIALEKDVCVAGESVSETETGIALTGPEPAAFQVRRKNRLLGLG